MIIIKNLATIYRITNNINGGTYIGQTTLSLKERLGKHIGDAKNNPNDDSLLYLAINHFGANNFSIEKIDETFFRHRFIVEQYYIEKELTKNHICYNKNVKGQDFKQKMSLVTSGSKNGMYGRTGNKAVNGQKVFMLDDDKKIIKEFNTVALALEFLNTKGHTALNAACRECKKYKGYYWVKTSKKYNL